jgi:hypothetical protein
MASFRSQLPSKSEFFKATDFDSGPRTLTIAEVSTTNLENNGRTELKLVASFREPDTKKLVLNLTRAEAIAEIVGSEDTDAWVGARISLRKGKTAFQGKRVDCMLVEAPKVSAAAEAVGF